MNIQTLTQKPIKLAPIFVCILGLGFAGVSQSAPRPAPRSTAPQLVQLDAKVNGAERPVTLNLVKGTYEVKPVGKAAGGVHEAWSVWDRTNCPRAKGCPRIVPTRFTGMHNNYYITSGNITNVTVDGTSLPVVKEIPQYRDYSYILQAGQNTSYEVIDNFTYPDEASALATAKTSVFTLSADGPVMFALLDKSRITDNRGGMTLQVRKLN